MRLAENDLTTSTLWWPQIRAAHAQRVEPKLVTPSFEEQSTVVEHAEVTVFLVGQASLGLSVYFRVEWLTENRCNNCLNLLSPAFDFRRCCTTREKQGGGKERVYNIFDYGHDLLWFSWTEENLARRFERDYRGFVQVVRWPLLAELSRSPHF